MDQADKDFYPLVAPAGGIARVEIRNQSPTLIPALTTFSSNRRASGSVPELHSPGANLSHTFGATPGPDLLRLGRAAREHGGKILADRAIDSSRTSYQATAVSIWHRIAKLQTKGAPKAARRGDHYDIICLDFIGFGRWIHR
jgi:hypothetical protein